MDINVWKTKNSKKRNYAHFDKKVCLRDIWSYINDPRNIKTHGFYPFIHYQLIYKKFNKSNGISPKTRELCYSAHIDRYIFQYYGYKLNQLYNERVVNDGINDLVIAYRDNLKKSNIHFAKKAIDFIRDSKSCFIIVGDFTNFFDNLDHKYLKKMLKELIGRLPEDYYAVFKNITRYSTWDMEHILELNGLPNNKKGIQALNQKDLALTLSQFKKYKSKYQKPNTKGYGIPQGSAISAVLSNIYMLYFDNMINDYVKKQNGLYMRYSDDFIIILPKNNESLFVEQYDFLIKTINSVDRLNLQPDKTQVFQYDNNQILSCNEIVSQGVINGKDILDYLGFSFDGNVVSIRDKTASKYYYRMYRKLKTIEKSKGITKKGNKISNKNLYDKYSIRGAFKEKGNFITYIKRAEEVFGKNELVNRVANNHMKQIRKRLDSIT